MARRNPKGGFGVQFSCTCIYHPHPATARLEIMLYDPFCGQRAHRLSGSTKFEPGYLFRR
ncbi:hypothetical protein MUG94_16800 [Arthrobacter gengyunqii]|uniref:hypothetical protein n=1 Tax=Arthrobacter gengyunqii TaxID=2886940 RepID=UPI001D138DB5|nr:hypothetical protein [Arthrobacter gengyunqii]UOY96158.1 hypothetical protein MUG94_16800 [Arthrobacter gengyunqii]